MLLLSSSAGAAKKKRELVPSREPHGMTDPCRVCLAYCSPVYRVVLFYARPSSVTQHYCEQKDERIDYLHLLKCTARYDIKLISTISERSPLFSPVPTVLCICPDAEQ